MARRPLKNRPLCIRSTYMLGIIRISRKAGFRMPLQGKRKTASRRSVFVLLLVIVFVGWCWLCDKYQQRLSFALFSLTHSLCRRSRSGSVCRCRDNSVARKNKNETPQKHDNQPAREGAKNQTNKKFGRLGLVLSSSEGIVTT